jgi:hypothetical protein
MKKIRNSNSAWELLERLVFTKADLVQCSDLNCLRFHLRSKGILGNIVRTSTLKTLVETGLVVRERTSTATYSVSDKGQQALQRILRRREFTDSQPSVCGERGKSVAVYS